MNAHPLLVFKARAEARALLAHAGECDAEAVIAALLDDAWNSGLADQVGERALVAIIIAAFANTGRAQHERPRPILARLRFLAAILGIVEPNDRLTIFANAAAEVASYVAKGLDKVVAADELVDMAISCGLDNADAVQAAIADAFKTNDSNGHDADARAPQGDEQAPPVDLGEWDAGDNPGPISPRQWLLSNQFCAASFPRSFCRRCRQERAALGTVHFAGARPLAVRPAYLSPQPGLVDQPGR